MCPCTFIDNKSTGTNFSKSKCLRLMDANTINLLKFVPVAQLDRATAF